MVRKEKGSAFGRAAVLLLGAAFGRSAAASTVVAESVEAMAQRADRVIEGRVVSEESSYIEPGVIATVAEVEVERAHKGAAALRVRVSRPGGVVGDIEQRVIGAPVLTPGDRVVLFLRERATEGGVPRCEVLGLSQGAFEILIGAEGPLARRAASGVALSGPEAAEALQEGELPLDALRARIRGAIAR